MASEYNFWTLPHVMSDDSAQDYAEALRKRQLLSLIDGFQCLTPNIYGYDRMVHFLGRLASRSLHIWSCSSDDKSVNRLRTSLMPTQFPIVPLGLDQNEFKILSELHWPRYTIGSLDESQLAEVLELTGRLPLLLDSFVTAWLKFSLWKRNKNPSPSKRMQSAGSPSKTCWTPLRPPSLHSLCEQRSQIFSQYLRPSLLLLPS